MRNVCHISTKTNFLVSHFVCKFLNQSKGRRSSARSSFNCFETLIKFNTLPYSLILYDCLFSPTNSELRGEYFQISSSFEKFSASEFSLPSLFVTLCYIHGSLYYFDETAQQSARKCFLSQLVFRLSSV